MGTDGSEDRTEGVVGLAGVPLLVWTDHKYLEYIQTAKRLPANAQWPQFFTRFDFTLSHHLGSINIKPDALSRQFLKGDNLG